MGKPKLVVLGGDTGSFTLLGRLKKLTPDITAIVNMSDDGGSTGVLRDEYGVLPPGDVRQCLVALSDLSEVRDLFSYRFADGLFRGQSMGNIILSGLELQYGSFEKAVVVASELLRITGRVVPVTLIKHTLVMQDGTAVVHGEHAIAEHTIMHRDTRLYLEPEAAINPIAADAIRAADAVIIAPGSVYGSLLPLLSTHGVAEVLKGTKAPVISVMNLVNKPGQTDGWHVADYVHELERYIGEGTITHVLYNTEPISPALLARYAAEGELPVHTEPDRFSEITAQVHGAQLVSKELSARVPGDLLTRTLIRHDAARVARAIKKLLPA